jgi:hypothetical protein
MPQSFNPGDAPTDQKNPANAPAKRATSATRIPMSVPQLRLEVPAIPGMHLHWFVSKNIHRAQKAGYTFVEDDEVDLANFGLADDASNSGNTDLGSRVSQFAGGMVEGTSDPQRLYLMKLPQEDCAALEATNEKIAAALRGGQTGPGGAGAAPQETAGDRGKRYLKTGQDLFIPKSRR